LQFIQLKWKRILPVFILMALVSGTVCRSEDLTESDIFPLYPCIQPNVDFWTKIYTQYSSDQGVIHDSRQMDRIYGTIALVDPYRGGGRKINQKRIKNAKRKYTAILTKLMQGKPPAGPEEQRVAEQFDPGAGAAVFRSARRYLRCQTGQKDRFREGLIRSGAYIDEIIGIFRDAGLPEDLAYLPHVESSFNARAYSKFGAAGMWQFTRATGKRFMKVGYTIDERRDPILSSHAATKLLRQNYRKLNSWPLALTAYNHGVTGMRKAQRKKGSYERIFKEYRSRRFRFASRNFYSEFLAAREAAKNYRQYFGDLNMNTPLKSQEIELRGYVSLPEIARHLDVDPVKLRELNPALRDPVFRGQKYVPRGYRLRLPNRNDTDWNQIIARVPPEIYRPKQKRSTIYRVRRGDTAGKIAKTHGVKLKDLIAFNNLDRRATIYVKQNLKIPLPEDKSIRVARLTDAKKAPAAPSPPAATPVPAQPALQSADSTDQAMRPAAANTNAKSLALADRQSRASNGKAAQAVPESQPVTNPLGENWLTTFFLALGAVTGYPSGQPAAALETEPAEVEHLIPGLEATPMIADIEFDLKADQSEAASLPEGRSRPAKQTAREPLLKPEIMVEHFAVDRVSKLRGKSIGFIRVEAEETLGHYAEWLKVSSSDIRRLNGFSHRQPLQLSQQLKLPLDRVAKEEFEEKRFEFHQEMAEDFFGSYRVEKVLTYSIKKGDNIWTLSHQEFEVPLWLIKRYNGDIDFSALVPSQKLLIPIIEKNV